MPRKDLDLELGDQKKRQEDPSNSNYEALPGSEDEQERSSIMGSAWNAVGDGMGWTVNTIGSGVKWTWNAAGGAARWVRGGEDLSEQYNKPTNLKLTAKGSKYLHDLIKKYPATTNAVLGGQFGSVKVKSLAGGMAAASVAQMSHSFSDDPNANPQEYNADPDVRKGLGIVLGVATIAGFLISKPLNYLEQKFVIDGKKKKLLEDVDSNKFSPAVQGFVEGFFQRITHHEKVIATPAELGIMFSYLSGMIALYKGGSFYASLPYGSVAGLVSAYVGKGAEADDKAKALIRGFKVSDYVEEIEGKEEKGDSIDLERQSLTLKEKKKKIETNVNAEFHLSALTAGHDGSLFDDLEEGQEPERSPSAKTSPTGVSPVKEDSLTRS